jgi:hypothetical protein
MIWWRAQINDSTPQRRADGLCVPVKTGEEYDIRAHYDRARESKDASLAPHLAFRKLKHGDNFAAASFLRRFGRLKISTLASCDWVSLDDFWCKHARYVGVVGLWEALNQDARELRKAWVRISRFAGEISKSETNPLRITPIGGLENGFQTSIGSGFSWKGDLQRLVSHATRAPISTLRDTALVLINRELNDHSGSRLARWDRLEDGDRFGFRPVFDNMSLWSAMWEFFGLDTADGIGWRICPHCGRPFYPARKDRFYCTPRQQQLHSKRQWWHRNRKAADTR